MSIKYAILVGDGMADLPIDELGGKTPIEYAATPNMDTIARLGRVGLIKTIPDGYEPGSDVANMSLMGFDPTKYYSGRAPIEAASMGINLTPKDIAFRCNLVHLENGKMIDYSAGHIETVDSVKIIAELAQELNTDSISFYPGVSYRHIVVIINFPKGKLVCNPPHNISGRLFADYLPKGPGEKILAELMEKARKILKHSGLNKQRESSGKITVTDIWLWGQGNAIKFPTLKERYSLNGSVISAVDLVKGLGKLAGLKVRSVKGATGYLGTNYAGKIEAAKSALTDEDFVFLHVEAPDETSHEGNCKKKIQAIEEFDRNIVGEMLKFQLQEKNVRIMVMPDHFTLLSTKTHHSEPVPFAVCGPGIKQDSTKFYCEKSAKEAADRIFTGASLFNAFIKGSF